MAMERQDGRHFRSSCFVLRASGDDAPAKTTFENPSIPSAPHSLKLRVVIALDPRM
jgi:hypothetical protein